MNILILTDYLPPDKLGGVGEIAKNLKSAFERQGHTVYVLTTGKQTDEDFQNNVFRSSKNLIWGVFLNNFIALSLIRKFSIDVINLHQSTTTLFLLAKLFKSFFGFPKVVNSFQVTYFAEFKEIKTVTLDGLSFRPTWYEFIEKFVFAPVHIVLNAIGYIFSDVVTSASTQVKNELNRTYGKFILKPTTYLPNGAHSLENIFLQYPHHLWLGQRIQNKKVLVYIGVFRMRKRVFNLLYALAKVVKKYDDVLLLIVGGGRGQEVLLKKLAHRLSLTDHVIFIGKVPNNEVPYFLHLADIFCLPSAYEGMPVAILEAMSMGKAIITSHISGMVDLIDDNVTGKLVGVDDIDNLANAILQLILDDDLRGTMGKNAKQTVADRFNWDKIAQQYLEVFI
jgi:glycosyltransferase involved in cell wall biosynthesis